MPRLGVNVDHVATLRQARRGTQPDPVEAAELCERAGAGSIIAHLREDRRHIQDRDIERLKKTVKTRFNLEMSINSGIVEKALAVRPHQATIDPERRREITTEGGLNVLLLFFKLKKVIPRLERHAIEVSLFIDPVKAQIQKAKALGVKMVELHTGGYANAKTGLKRQRELDQLRNMTGYARSLGLRVSAGHGLNYENSQAVARIEGMEELNIGHAIVSRAVLVGLEKAVREMSELVQ